MRASPSLGLLPLLLIAGCVSIDDPQPATPQRPTLSSDTSTTAPGTLELEVGADVDPDGPFIIPSTLKYGAGERTEVFTTWLAWQRREDVTGDEEGIGDLALGLRHRFRNTGPSPSLGAQAVVKLPVASSHDGLSSGETDVLLSAMATWSGSEVSGTLFYELGLLGDPDDSGVEVSHLPALAGGLSLGSGFGLIGEAAGIFVPEQDVQSGVFTFGLGWSPRPQLVFDVGARAGIGDAPDVVLFAGMTWNWGRPSISSR